MFITVISLGFNRCESLNTSLLDRPRVFYCLHVGDGQPKPKKGNKLTEILLLIWIINAGYKI